MSAPRFFVDGACAPGSDIALDREDARHVRLVLRLRAGDPVIVVHAGVAWDAALTHVGASQTRARVERARSETGGELPVAVTVMQALTKGTKFDDVVEKTVELGARHIVPVLCERSLAEASANRVERWRRIARAAAQQARRRFLPTIETPVPWADALHDWRGATAPIVAFEGAAPRTLAPALEQADGSESLAIAIGPEGGLAQAEVDAAIARGCALVSLGPTVLRTETAASAMLAAIAARMGWW